MNEKEILIKKLKALEREYPITEAERYTWLYRRKSLRNTMRTSDYDFNNFYSWPVIQESFLTGATGDTLAAYHMLDSQHKAAATDPPIGGVEKTRLRRLPNGASGTYVRQALACQLLAGYILDSGETNKLEPHSWGSIFEFGGGFGAMAYVLNRLGFNNRHIIYDFPESSVLQEWYLNKLGVTNVEYLNSIDGLSTVTSYHHIFMSLCGIDETTEAVRSKILYKVHAGVYFIWYSKNPLGDATEGKIDNRAWFTNYFDSQGYKITYLNTPSSKQGIIIAEA